MSKVLAIYHLVFCTKQRINTIPNEHSEDLYRFLWSILREYKCFVYHINGTPNHIHIAIDLNPNIAISQLMRDLKAKSSGFLKADPRFPYFNGWAHEYFATTVSISHRNNLIEYIKTQREHHTIKSFDEELNILLRKAGFTTIHENDMR